MALDFAVLVGTGVPAGAKHSRPARRPAATGNSVDADHTRYPSLPNPFFSRLFSRIPIFRANMEKYRAISKNQLSKMVPTSGHDFLGFAILPQELHLRAGHEFTYGIEFPIIFFGFFDHALQFRRIYGCQKHIILAAI
jgi:hypothetical protein